jgi:hypothetical protein
VELVLWPAVVTLAVTLLRLTGELLDWTLALFNRSVVLGMLVGVPVTALGRSAGAQPVEA